MDEERIKGGIGKREKKNDKGVRRRWVKWRQE